MAMAFANVSLKLDTNTFKDQMKKAGNSMKSGIDQMKNMMMAAALGQYLFAGANDAINAQVDQMYAKLNLMNEGLSELQYDQIAAMSEKFELLGSNAETAQLKLTEFIVQGKSRGLTEIGIYLDKNTQSMLMQATAAERLQWAMSNLPSYLEDMSDMLPESTKNMLEMRKTLDEVKEAMGATFLGVINGLVNAFGGLVPAMKTALIAFTAYKVAMIIGNTAIGISKALAIGSVFAAPVAFAMGAAALLSLGALIGGAGLAISALNSIPDPDDTINAGAAESNKPVVEVTITQDKFGQISEVVNNSGGGGSSSTQTKF